MLTAMQRETSGDYIRDLIKRMRQGAPHMAIRTTFIVGFPGETEEDFVELLKFLEDTQFDRVGIFKYSQEEGTKAAKMEGHLPSRTKQARYKRAMVLQQRIAQETSQEQVGRVVRALVDSPLVARGHSDAPDIDGRIQLKEPATVGEFINVRITEAQLYDLIGEKED
jgi:ribosomal protein S12 methylthiotransferase